MNKRIAVVGGSNIDITATSFSPLVFQDSNPGFMELSVGGVGRNIAENLARLGFDVHLISAVGNDQYHALLQQNAQAVGLDMSHCLVMEDASTSCYLCINQPDGDIAVAVAAMGICDRMLPEVLQPQMEFLNSCDYVIMDTNLPQETILYLAQHCTARLCADTVSVKKAVKLKPALPSLFFIKANRAEAEAISDQSISAPEDFESAARALHAVGVQNIAITASENRAFFSDGRESYMLPPMLADTVNSTGCGDAFFAGALTALMERRGARPALERGLAMASICATSDHAVSPDASMEEIGRVIAKYIGGESK